MANVNKCDIALAIFACCGILAGISGFIAFLFIFYNIAGGIWALLSATYACLYLFLLVLHIHGGIDRWYGTAHLFRLGIFGSIGIIGSTVAFVSYLAVAISSGESLPNLDTVSDSHYIMAIWAALTLKWSVAMTLYARQLNHRLRGGYQSI